MKRSAFILLSIATLIVEVRAQGFMRKKYHDAERQHLKEIYFVRDTISNILDGRYISYYLNGNIESRGQFENNETAGVWEFYYETGNLKMRGILLKNSNYGRWEYFFENGTKAMEGMVNGRDREGEWKIYYENGQIKEEGEYAENQRTGLWQTFFEDGKLRGEIEYDEGFGRFTEYYPSGKVYGEGPKRGTQQVGHWRYFAEDGTLKSEGDYEKNKKNGEWANYHASGKMSSKGQYENDVPVGEWTYFFEDGTLSAHGNYFGGQRSGYWNAFNNDGTIKSEVTLSDGSGEYREYYEGGKLKVKGMIVDDKKEGKWLYYYPDGRLEGECDFKEGKGTYHGYYPNGSLQTKGEMVDDRKTGTWEIYETDGSLSGYYKPFYSSGRLGKEISDLAARQYVAKKTKWRFDYFDQRFSEFRGLIVGTDPLLVFAGRLPFGMEFYFEERLGHEFEFTGIRDPFFESDDLIPPGKAFQRGYGIAFKQKFYNPLKIGMWYFGHEIRFTNLGHYVNVPVGQIPGDIATASSYEQRIEYGLLLGYRIMQQNNRAGFTIDAFISGDVGYRSFDIEPTADSKYFDGINKSKLANSIHFGLNFGNVFAYR